MRSIRINIILLCVEIYIKFDYYNIIYNKMDIKFCDNCDNFMSFCIDEDTKPIYKCTKCTHITTYDHKTDMNGIIFNKNEELKNMLKYNSNLILDITLPTINNKNIKCINSECESNKKNC